MRKNLELFFLFSVFVNVICVVVNTLPAMDIYENWFKVLDVVFLGIFLFEYFLRLWLAPKMGAKFAGWRGRLRYLVTPFALIDALALLPLVFIGTDAQSTLVRVVRLLSVFRVLKMLRYEKALHHMADCLRHKRDELVIVLLCLLVFVLLASSGMYMLEHDAQPKVFDSIPAALWWAVISVTTIGYGDIVPVTTGGKVLAGVSALVGVLLIAVLTSIVSSAFLEVQVTKRGVK
jgi:voltage-gated potassium channel